MIKNYFILTFFLFALLHKSFAQTTGDDADFLSEYRPLGEATILFLNGAYTDTTASPEERAKDLISRMTFEEKVRLTGGWTGIKVRGSFNIPGVGRLGIRPVTMSDASQGIQKIPFPSQGR